MEVFDELADTKLFIQSKKMKKNLKGQMSKTKLMKNAVIPFNHKTVGVIRLPETFTVRSLWVRRAAEYITGLQGRARQIQSVDNKKSDITKIMTLQKHFCKESSDC